MKPLVLIIDDDAKLNTLLGTYLADFGMNTVAAVTPEDGLRELHAHRPDLIILDVMLPGMSGFDLCRAIRRTDRVPIIMLTARGEVADRIVGLELGADDYLPKPFEPRELVARIQSVLRRPRAVEREVRRFGPLVVDLARREATLDGAPVELTTNEFEVLRLLTDHPGEVLDRDRILETLRGIGHDGHGGCLLGHPGKPGTGRFPDLMQRMRRDCLTEEKAQELFKRKRSGWPVRTFYCAVGGFRLRTTISWLRVTTRSPSSFTRSRRPARPPR